MQTVRGGVLDRGDRGAWEIQFRGMLHAQLPGIHGRVYELGGNHCGEQEREGLREQGDRQRKRVHVASLSFGANYKAAYCLAVCPAGEEEIAIAPFLGDRKRLLEEVVKPLQEKRETGTWYRVRMRRGMWCGDSHKNKSSGLETGCGWVRLAHFCAGCR
jgi:hypothetical protein